MLVAEALLLPRHSRGFIWLLPKKNRESYDSRFLVSIIHPILNSLEQVHLSVLIGALKSTFLSNLTNDFIDKVFLFFNYDLLFFGFSAAGFDILWGSFRYNDEKRVQSRRRFQSRNASRSPGFPIARRQAAAVPFCSVSG